MQDFRGRSARNGADGAILEKKFIFFPKNSFIFRKTRAELAPESGLGGSELAFGRI